MKKLQQVDTSRQMLIHCPFLSISFHLIPFTGLIAPNIPDLIRFKSFSSNPSLIHFDLCSSIFHTPHLSTTGTTAFPSCRRQGEVALLAAPARRHRCRRLVEGCAALCAVLGDAVAVQTQRALAARAEEGHGQVVRDLGWQGYGKDGNRGLRGNSMS